MVAELRWALTEYERLYPIFIKDRQGMSGCYDIELLISKCSHSWAKDYSRKERVLSLHISCADKMNEGIPDMFSGDLLEILHFMDNDVIYKIKSRKGRLYSYPKRGSKAIEEVASICGSMD